MPAAVLTIYCGNQFSVEWEHEFKERARELSRRLTGNSNKLGKGAYGRIVGRPKGIPMAEAIFYLLRARPDAVTDLFRINGAEALSNCIRDIVEQEPSLRSAILHGLGEATEEGESKPSTLRELQSLTNAPPRRDPLEVEWTPEIDAELAERERTLDLRLRNIKVPPIK